MDSKQLVKEAFALARTPYEPFTTKYGEYSSIYLAPTGNVKDMMAGFKNAKRVLAVGGMGAFGLESAINGAEKVDMFDCNYLQKCFFELVKASIMVLSYEEFMDYFTLKEQSEVMLYSAFSHLLSTELYIKVSGFLPSEVQFLYDQLYSHFDSIELIHSALYRYEHAMYREYLMRFASIYNEEEYYKMQDILRKNRCQISYEQAFLIDLPKRFEGPYDLIVLDNILQYHRTISGLQTPYEVNTFIKKKLYSLLAPDGVIQVNYGFETPAVFLKSKLGLPYPKNMFNSNYIGQMIIKENIKKDINCVLWDKGGYEVSFIEGIESYEGRDAENFYLTYRPNSQKK